MIADLTDPADPVVVLALTHGCEMCKAVAGQECRNTISDKPLPFHRVIHYARVEQWDVQ